MNKKILYKNKDAYYLDGCRLTLPAGYEFLEAGIQRLSAKNTQLCVENGQLYYVVMEKRSEEQYADRLGTFYPQGQRISKSLSGLTLRFSASFSSSRVSDVGRVRRHENMPI